MERDNKLKNLKLPECKEVDEITKMTASELMKKLESGFAFSSINPISHHIRKYQAS